MKPVKITLAAAAAATATLALTALPAAASTGTHVRPASHVKAQVPCEYGNFCTMDVTGSVRPYPTGGNPAIDPPVAEVTNLTDTPWCVYLAPYFNGPRMTIYPGYDGLVPFPVRSLYNEPC
jgi:hypothetical protein